MTATQNTNRAKFSLELRKTHRFNAGWAHLDQWETIGTGRELSSRVVSKDEDGYSANVLLSVNVSDKDATQRDIEDAICDRFVSGCRCEHDCCGHYQSYASRVRRVPNSNLYFVRVRSYRNV